MLLDGSRIDRLLSRFGFLHDRKQGIPSINLGPTVEALGNCIQYAKAFGQVALRDNGTCYVKVLA
jgi:hypothetical protein